MFLMDLLADNGVDTFVINANASRAWYPSKTIPSILDGYRRGDREFFRGHAICAGATEPAAVEKYIDTIMAFMNLYQDLLDAGVDQRDAHAGAGEAGRTLGRQHGDRQKQDLLAERQVNACGLGDEEGGEAREKASGTWDKVEKAFDNRVGMAGVIQTGQMLMHSTLPNRLILCGTVQEEVGLRGAKTAAAFSQPDVAIILEGPPADDTPGFYRADCQGRLGGGGPLSLPAKPLVIFDGQSHPHE